MVEMLVHKIGLSPDGEALVILVDVEQTRLMAIVVGTYEARSIALELQGEKFERPLTHDLFADTLAALEQVLERVEVVKLEGGTYYAVMTLRGPDGVVRQLDARPSDAIAIALRCQATIYVAETVLQQSQILFSDLEAAEEVDKFRELMETVQLGDSQGSPGPPPAAQDDEATETEDDP